MYSAKSLGKRNNSYTPAVMWFTSGNINKREMRFQLEGFKAQGINDFFIHPSDNTQSDYLGEHFFAMIRYAVEVAKELGLNYWIYDEYNWPSGTAGGRVIYNSPQSRMSCLCRLSKAVRGGETVRIDLPPHKELNTTPLLYAVDGRSVGAHLEGDTVVWHNDSDGEKTLEVYFYRWFTNLNDSTMFSDTDVAIPVEGYLDTLNPDAVDLFIHTTLDEYKKHIGADFGGCVRGVFTDEPQASYICNRDAGQLPWTPRMPEEFLKRRGYDIIPRLHQIFSGEDKKLLIDYWETVADLFYEAYMVRMSRWCKENGLIYTGHLLWEEEVDRNAVYSGDMYRCYGEFDWPGIDTICSYYRINDYNFNFAGKLCCSAARFHGKERTLCETYTISGWKIRLRDMKRIFNRLAILGVNFLQYMGAHYNFTLAAQTITMTNNWQNPLFKHYGALSDYISGVQELVASTEYSARALLFYPVTAARAELTDRPPTVENLQEMNRTVQGLTNALLSLHVPFEVGFEEVIDSAEVRDGKMIIKGSAYDLIILPCAKYVKKKTWDKLYDFASSGGRIVAVNGAPQKCVGDTIEDAGELPGLTSYECYDFDIISDKSRFDYDKASCMGSFAAALASALKGLPDYVYRITPCDGIISALRRTGGKYYAIIANDNARCATVSGAVTVPLPWRILSAECGEEKKIKKVRNSFEVELSAFECVILEIGEAEHSAFLEDNLSEKEIPVKMLGLNMNGENCGVPMPSVVRGTVAEKIISAMRRDNPRKVCTLAANLEDSEIVPCRTTRMVLIATQSKADWHGWYPIDGTAGNPGETVVCIYDFEIDAIPRVLDLICDSQQDIRWYLNDERILPSGVRREWHYSNEVFDLTDAVALGKNRLVAAFTLPDVQTKYPVPAAMLKGDFRVFPNGVLTSLPGKNELAYWNEQGYYYYVGDGTYWVEFEARSGDKIILEADTTDAVEVFLNGEQVAKLLWDPYRADLTGYIKDGKNRLDIRVSGTYSNFIYEKTPTGLNSVRLYLQNKN